MSTTVTRDEAVEALATEPVMQTVARILRDKYAAGWRHVTVNSLRDELAAAGVEGNRIGCVITAASRHGWIADTGRMVVCQADSARKRRVVQWALVGWRIPEQVAA